jgi:hypothetical protein
VARHVLADGEVPNCKLATLADFFGAPVRPRHRALADAQATAAVLTSLLGRLAAGGTATLAQFRRAQAKRRRAERRRGGGPPGPDRSGPGSRLPDTALPENALPGTAGPARAAPCAAEAGGGPVPGARLAR